MKKKEMPPGNFKISVLLGVSKIFHPIDYIDSFSKA